SMSLLPGEPMDADEFVPSMTSDAVLAQINQIPKRDYERAGLLRELVSVKLQFGGTTSMMLFPFAVAPGVYTVDLSIDGREGLADARVETGVKREGKEEARVASTFAKDAPLIGRLVLPAGEYVVEATISDTEGKQTFAARDVLHLKPAADAFAMSD